MPRGSADDPPYGGQRRGTQPECGNSGFLDTANSELGRQLGQAVPQNPSSPLTMASLSSENRLGGAGSLRQVGSASGLADSRMREAGSGHCGKSSKHPTKFRAATWNVVTLKSRSVEVVETLSRRRVDLCGVQEHRWAGSLAANQTRLIKGKDSTFKFFWCGKERGQGGACSLLAEKWMDKVFDVLRISDRIILIRLVIGKVVFTFLSVYAPQAGLQEAEKDRFYDQFQNVMARIPASEVLIPLGDWNGHVGADSNGFEEVHHGKGFGVRIVEGEIVGVCPGKRHGCGKYLLQKESVPPGYLQFQQPQHTD